MGTLLKKTNKRKELLEHHIDTFVKRSNLMYTPLFEGSPTFVTYYSIDNINTTVDQNLEGVIENLGEESPIQYQKIEDFVLYGMDPSNLALEISEMGARSTYEGEATILPNTVIPKPNDYFILNYDKSKYVFQLTAVTPDKLHNYKFYKIEYKLRTNTVEEIEKQVQNEYVTLYDSLGTNNKVIVEKSNAIILKELDIVIRELQSKYIKLFYLKKFEVLAVRGSGLFEDSHLYSSHIVKFVRDNALLKIKDPYFESIFITDPLELETDFDFSKEYDESIYNSIMQMNKYIVNKISFMQTRIDDVRFPANNFYEQFYDTVLFDENFIAADELFKIVNLSPDFRNKILNYELYEDNLEYFYENLIILFLNKELIFNMELIKKIEDYNIYLKTFTDNKSFQYKALKGFFYVPIMLYLLVLYSKNLLESNISKNFIHYNSKVISYNEMEISSDKIISGDDDNLVELIINDLDFIKGNELLLFNDNILKSYKGQYYFKNNGNIVIKNIPFSLISSGILKLKFYKMET